MKILIDTADVVRIRRLYGIAHFDGVTTNPRLLSQISGRPYEILEEIREALPKEAELHVQVVSGKREQMLLEAEDILERLGKDTHIKIPVCAEGYPVIRELAFRGISVTATAIYNGAQAAMAAQQGAAAVAPYIHRICNRGYDGVQTALEIQRLLTTQALKTELLAAAFENTSQVMTLLSGGVASVTVNPELLTEVCSNSMTEEAVVDFYQGFQKKFGQESMMA